jgi:hypothetical protein
MTTQFEYKGREVSRVRLVEGTTIALFGIMTDGREFWIDNFDVQYPEEKNRFKREVTKTKKHAKQLFDAKEAEQID